MKYVQYKRFSYLRMLKNDDGLSGERNERVKENLITLSFKHIPFNNGLKSSGIFVAKFGPKNRS